MIDLLPPLPRTLSDEDELSLVVTFAGGKLDDVRVSFSPTTRTSLRDGKAKMFQSIPGVEFAITVSLILVRIGRKETRVNRKPE